MKPVSSPIRSSSGAFDLPSIITGVVVVGILTAGVLAAIFGVIPWAQDRSAKQDLAAINTAQGVTYAKDGQVYKDLAGLDDARLASGLDQARTTVKTGKAGKTYSASTLSSSGKNWCITNENTDPWECTEALPGTAAPADWSGAFCGPEVKSTMDADYAMYLDPAMQEYLKAQLEMPYDEADLADWIDKYMRDDPPYNPDTLDPELVATLGDMNRPVQDALLSGITGLPNENVEEWPELHAKAVEAYNAAGAAFCSTYTGPVAPPKEHPSRADTFVDKRQALTGDQNPVVLGYTFDFGSEDTFDIAVSGAEGIAGFKTSSHGFEMLDGKPYWTTTLVPGPSGWGESAETARVTLTITRKSDTQKARKEERVWEIKANSDVLKIVQDSTYFGMDTLGYGDTWDQVIRHKGSGDAEIYYSIEQPGGIANFNDDVWDAVYYEKPEILEMTKGMNAIAGSTGWTSDESAHYGWRISAADGSSLGLGTIKFKQDIFNPKTYARVSHVYSYTVIDPPAGEEVHLSAVSADRDVRDFEYHQDTTYTLDFDVPGGYHRGDYQYEATYAGQKADASSWPYFEIEQYVSASISVFPSGTSDAPNGRTPYATVVIDIGDSSRGAYVPPEDVVLTATYLPTGESASITVKLP